MPARDSQMPTVAPPAGTTTLDLVKEFGGGPIHPAREIKGDPKQSSHPSTAHHPTSAKLHSSSSKTTEKPQHSSSTSKLHQSARANEASRDPSSSTRRERDASLETSRMRNPLSPGKIHESSRPRWNVDKSQTSSSKAHDSSRQSSSRRHESSQVTSSRTESHGGRTTRTETREKKGPLAGIFGGNKKTTVTVSQDSRVPVSRENGQITSGREDRSRAPSSTHHHSEHSSRHQSSQTSSTSGHRPSTSHRQPSSHALERQAAAQQTARVATGNYAIGNMERTYLEGVDFKSMDTKGLIPASKYEKHSAAQQTYANSSGFRSMAPSTAPSLFQNDRDLEGASRQSRYDTLSALDQEKQDVWAKSVIGRFAPCPEKFTYERVQDGYMCKGKHHFISDELVAEGKGALWVLADEGDPQPANCWGPYYSEKADPTVFFYSGPDPIPDGAPPTLGDGTPELERLRRYGPYRLKLLRERQGTQMLQSLPRPGSIMQMMSSQRRASGFPPGSRPPHGGHGTGSHFPNGTNGPWGNNPDYR